MNTFLSPDIEMPYIFFKGLSEFIPTNENQIEEKKRRFLKFDTFSKIPFPDKYFVEIYSKANWYKIETFWPDEAFEELLNRKVADIYLREPHYLYFLKNFKEGYYFDTNNKEITKEQFFLLSACFIEGYLRGVDHIEQTYTHKKILSNQQLFHEIIEKKIEMLSIDRLALTFDFIIENDHFYKKGTIMGINYCMNNILNKIPLSELPQIIEETSYKTKWEFYHKNLSFSNSIATNLKFRVTEDIKNNELNFFNKMPLYEAYKFFKSELIFLTEENLPIVTEENLNLFFLRAFRGMPYPRPSFNSTKKNGIIAKIYSVFYNFYKISISNLSYESRPSIRDAYIKLLSDNFQEMDYKVIKNNFRA